MGKVKLSVADMPHHRRMQPLGVFQDSSALLLFVRTSVRESAAVNRRTVCPLPGSEQKFHGVFLKTALVDAVRISVRIDNIMSGLLCTEYHSGKLMCLVKRASFGKQLHYVTQFRFVAYAHILHLYQHSGILNNTAYDLVCHFHHLPRSGIGSGEPDVQGLPHTFVLHFQFLLPVLCLLGEGSWNIQFASVYQLQKRSRCVGGYRFQLCAYLRRAALKILNEIFQIGYQVAFIHNKIFRFHIFLRTGTVKFPEIVLIALAEP